MVQSRAAVCLILLTFLPACRQGAAPRQAATDADFLREIERIRAVDNHSHGDAAGAALAEVEALPGTPAFPYPVRLRTDNPEYIDAWRALYGYSHRDMAPDHLRQVLAAKQALRREQGEAYPLWVLDRAGIETALVNAPALGPGQSAPRFRWVPSADALLYPFEGEDEGVRALRGELHLGPPPPTLDEYLRTEVTGRLESWRKSGAIAVKFAIAYRRSLSFTDVERSFAASLFTSGAQGRKLAPPNQNQIEGFLMREICREAGRLGLVVHIHTGIGADPYFSLKGSDPLLLESLFDDPELRSTRFVMIHGGWPFERSAGAMLIRPNVYADISAQVFLRSTSALSETLEDWLDWYPEKVLFGTDAYSEPGTPLATWEEKAWLTSRTARQALALALSRMIGDGRISRGRAIELARMVLRENALQLYGL
jgi:predicted TIM-barrel fold metal-dependent hydrolase